ncbi:MAG TPA: PAS domain-containing protein [Candidatus Acidoferrales bacterium]|nr:PAS domain-containing protein [Candidatus Acidoferrales bacterium]
MRSHGIWMIDLEGQTVYVNTRLADALGVEPTEMIDRPYLDWVFPEDAPKAKSIFESKKAGNGETFRFRLRHKDGSVVYVRIQATAMHSATSNMLIGLVGAVSFEAPGTGTKPGA